ncbi:MAG: hypothetical protein J6P53_01045 [Mailhella sp.]|nr:hypothetical protein [Mailhella sp.]
MRYAFFILALAVFLWTLPAQADEFESSRQEHGAWYSCIYASGQEHSSRLATRRTSPDASLVIDLYAGGKDPIGIRLYTPLDPQALQLDGRTNHGSIDLDGKEWGKASFAVYAFPASECAYVYPQNDFLEDACHAHECTIHIINEFGVKRSLTFSLKGFSEAKRRSETLLREIR